jgi:hypothetical protein
MNPARRFFKIFSAISVFILAGLTLAGCGNAAIAAQINNGTITICHANGSTTTPYDQITISFAELIAHADHPDDIIPAPAGGCPNTLEKGVNTGKITICHATGSATNPFTEITIDFNGLHGHINHKDDIIPAPSGGCPSVTATPITMTPTVTGTLTVTPTPASTQGNVNQKITICHATGSSKHPYVMITIDINGLNGHKNHPHDIIPAPAGGCPTK